MHDHVSNILQECGDGDNFDIERDKEEGTEKKDLHQFYELMRLLCVGKLMHRIKLEYETSENYSIV